MEVKNVTNHRNRTIFFLVDDDGKVIQPVYEYMLFLMRNGKKKNTVKNICHCLKLYFEWLKIAGLTYKTAVDKKSPTNKGIMLNLTAFKTWLKFPSQKGNIIILTPRRIDSTINQITSAVYGFYNFLTANEEINDFPMYTKMKCNSQFKGMLSEMVLKNQPSYKSVLKEREAKKVIKYITLSEYNRMQAEATNLRDKVILALLYDGGLRVSEAIGINLSDLRDIHKNTIHITYREDINNPDAAVKYYSTGDVIISDFARDLIIKYINEFLSYIDTNYLLINMYGDTKYQPMRTHNIENIISRLAKKAKIDRKITPHALRHGCAVLMYNNGAPIKQIQDKLRHQSPNTTAAIYAQFDDEGRKKAMATSYEKANMKCNPNDMTLDDLHDWLLKEDEDYE